MCIYNKWMNERLYVWFVYYLYSMYLCYWRVVFLIVWIYCPPLGCLEWSPPGRRDSSGPGGKHRGQDHGKQIQQPLWRITSHQRRPTLFPTERRVNAIECWKVYVLCCSHGLWWLHKYLVRTGSPNIVDSYSFFFLKNKIKSMFEWMYLCMYLCMIKSYQIVSYGSLRYF